ncbi:MAG TPA: T9SS type A sorting domain-containing protein, partial [Candidatus Marinimicrobia bacterium]|nr:T9SS type A sorting domain-containing protein [Candidatus Neomarinimicrobiota bacterium]
YGLDGSGELIRLFDPSGILVDAVDYDDSYPWPEEADGEGPTLELIDPTQDNALGVNWSASEGHGSPGVINTSLSIQNITIVPDGFMVFNNYPNPFNPTTIISYVLPIDASVTITIHDIMGRKVRTLVNSRQTAGFKTIQWNATNDNRQPVAAGIYIYTVQSGEFRQSRKMLLLK